MGLRYQGVRLDQSSISSALAQAKKMGVGWVRINDEGEMEHVDTRQVQHHEDAPLDGGDGLGMPWDR